MSPEFTILAEIDLVTSKSEKPEGAITNDFEVKIPTLISRPSLLRTYVFEALSASKRGKLSTHAKKSAKPVHNTIGVNRTIFSATSNKNSSQKNATAATMVNMLLVTTLGSIHGLPVQSARAGIFKSPDACCSFSVFLSNLAKRALQS